MIARGIVNHPRILLFDEVTSALDNRRQEIVTQSLQELQDAHAHRLSTAQALIGSMSWTADERYRRAHTLS